MLEEENINKLKQAAEARLDGFSELEREPSLNEVKSLIHDLAVHQIELEMQNEELREAQHRLEESRDQYSDLFEFAPWGYFILNKQGIILNCNLTACGILNLDRTQIIKKPFAFFIPAVQNDSINFRQYLTKVFASETVETMEVVLNGKDNENAIVRLDTKAILDEEGKLNQCRMAMVDISKEKKGDALQAYVDATLQGQEIERERIARELHDSINPLLSITSLNVSSLLSSYKENKSLPKDQIKHIISLLDDAMEGVKEISSNLSTAILRSFGLPKALEELCKNVRKVGQFKIDYHSHGLIARLEANIELALYRIAQELLNNILKHADASDVELQIIHHKETIVLMVSDNGKGFEAPLEELKTNGFGFKNIASRIHSLNGNLSIDSTRGKGTTVTVELPI